jgi:hypothetical protein
VRAKVSFLNAIEIEPAGRYVQLVKNLLTDAIAAEIDRTRGIYSINGMSGARYRYFINKLVGQLGQTAYLEIGSWTGSTLCSAIHGNAVRALAIDNWSQFGGPKDVFLANVERFRTPQALVELIESDFRKVPFAELSSRFSAFRISCLMARTRKRTCSMA